MIKVRTDNDFYFQCYIMAYLYNMKICYLGIQSANKNNLYFDSIIFPNEMPKSNSSENPFFLSSTVTVTFLTYIPPNDEYCYTIPTKKSLVISNFLHHENHLEVLKRRVITGIRKYIPNIKRICYSETYNDFQLAHQDGYNQPLIWGNVGYTYDQINELMKRDSLEAAMKQPEEGIAISIGAPGEEVWGFMKSTVAIRFRQKDNWYYVAYSLASPLHFIGGCDHIYNEIVKLASVIDAKDYKF